MPRGPKDEGWRTNIVSIIGPNDYTYYLTLTTHHLTCLSVTFHGIKNMANFGETLDMVIEEALRHTPEDKGIEWFLDRVLESANMPRVRARYISSFLADRERQLIKRNPHNR